MIEIDHFMWVASDLDAGIEEIADRFGVRPANGGSHVGLGTRNALLSLGSVYLEILAPDPQQRLHENLGEAVANLHAPGLATWAARGDLSAIARHLSAIDLNCNGPVRTRRETEEGSLMEWDLLFPANGDLMGTMPFFIDWLDCAHPAATNPSGGAFQEFEIVTPHAERLRSAIGDVPDTRMATGEARLTLHVQTERGPVSLSGDQTTLALFG